MVVRKKSKRHKKVCHKRKPKVEDSKHFLEAIQLEKKVKQEN